MQPKDIFQPNECVPEIQIMEVLQRVDPELTETHSIDIPSTGDNGVLLEWCLTAASNNHQLNKQVKAIRESN